MVNVDFLDIITLGKPGSLDASLLAWPGDLTFYCAGYMYDLFCRNVTKCLLYFDKNSNVLMQWVPLFVFENTRKLCYVGR